MKFPTFREKGRLASPSFRPAVQEKSRRRLYWGGSMGATKIPVTKQAYGYPLLIKQLLHLPLSNTPDQVIVYRDQVRQTYREFGARLRRLASGLSDLGVGQG